MLIIDTLQVDGKTKNEFLNLEPDSVLFSVDKGLLCFLLRILCSFQIFGFICFNNIYIDSDDHTKISR